MFAELNALHLDKLIKLALEEDVGGGDITTLATVRPQTVITGNLLAKEVGMICGMPVFERVFSYLDPDVSITIIKNDGEFVESGEIIARIDGPARSILTGERVALNFLQRMSAIATRTAWAVEQVRGSKAIITDTRKTTPGLRILEKYAVRVGGGRNHRFNLADGVLIKDNHIQAAGGIAAAVDQARQRIPHTLKIEVEVENSRQIDEALTAGVDIIMLDNMDKQQIEAAAAQINGRAMIEISGNMGQRDLAELAATGIDLISIGALTHTVQAMDISLRLQAR